MSRPVVSLSPYGITVYIHIHTVERLIISISDPTKPAAAAAAAVVEEDTMAATQREREPLPSRTK